MKWRLTKPLPQDPLPDPLTLYQLVADAVYAIDQMDVALDDRETRDEETLLALI